VPRGAGGARVDDARARARSIAAAPLRWRREFAAWLAALLGLERITATRC
jgi:hypothetical protein